MVTASVGTGASGAAAAVARPRNIKVPNSTPKGVDDRRMGWFGASQLDPNNGVLLAEIPLHQPSLCFRLRPNIARPALNIKRGGGLTFEPKLGQVPGRDRRRADHPGEATEGHARGHSHRASRHGAFNLPRSGGGGRRGKGGSGYVGGPGVC